MKLRLPIFLGISAAAILLTGGGILVYQLQNEQTQNAPEVLTPEADILDNGLGYTNEEYGIKFRYPEGWEIEETGWDDFLEKELITFNPRERAYKNIDGHTIDPIAIGIENIGEWEFTVGIERKGDEILINDVTAYRLVGYENKVQYWFEHPTKDFHFSVENRIPAIVKAMDLLPGESRFPNVETAGDITPQERAELEQSFELVLFSFSMIE